MQQLKILEHTPNALFAFMAVGTLASLIVLYFLFTHNWVIALVSFLLIDILIFGIYKYTSNIEHKIVEINETGVITNALIIKYSEISEIGHEVKESYTGKMPNKLNYLIIRTPKEKHVFFTDSYKNSQEEIINCIRQNMTASHK